MGMTLIEWADRSWNPITGCTAISEGCANCYAARMAKRLGGRFGYPADEPFRVTWHPERLEEPLSWRKPSRVFVCSMGDIFHEDIDTHLIDDILEVIAACPQHIFMMLTKRPQNIERKLYETSVEHGCRELGGGDYLPNLWLGVTAENQARAAERIPVLLSIPAGKHFVSVEPMLGMVDLTKIFRPTEASLANPCSPPTWNRWNALSGFRGTEDHHGRGAGFVGAKLDWVIAGPETGPGARPCNPVWIVDLARQCREAGVAFFDKSKECPIVREWPR